MENYDKNLKHLSKIGDDSSKFFKSLQEDIDSGLEFAKNDRTQIYKELEELVAK